MDLDGDGFGSDVDCDDEDAAVNPDAREICDGIDNDCDGAVDAADDAIEDATVWYLDHDGDGYGDASEPEASCAAAPPRGYTADSTDCYDANDEADPGASEGGDAAYAGVPYQNFWTTDRGDGSFDYDCDGEESRLSEWYFFLPGCYDGTYACQIRYCADAWCRETLRDEDVQCGDVVTVRLFVDGDFAREGSAFTESCG